MKNRTDQIVWKDLVPKYEFQHTCEEVSDAVVQFLVKEGYDVATQSKTQVVTEKKYRNAGRQYDPPEQQQTTVVIGALQSAGAGCRIEITTTDRYGTYRPDSARAPGWEMMVIEKLEPERGQAMRAEATQRAEAENPPEKPVANAQEPPGPSPPPAPAANVPPPAPAANVPPPAPAANIPPPAANVPPPAPAANVITGAPASPPAPAPAKGRPWYFWTAATATAVFTAGAIVTGLSANSRFSDLENSCGLTSAGCSHAEIDSVKSRATVANVLWILAGASAIATSATFFVGSREAGVSIAGRF